MSERLAQILISSFTRILIPGIKVTIPLTLISFVLGCTIALFLAVVQTANIKGLKQFSRFYIWVFRGTPLIVQLFIIFFGLPSVGIVLDAFPSAVIAFCTEPWRIQCRNFSVLPSRLYPQGQTEAAYMIGLNYPQTMLRVVMPPGISDCIPAIIQFPDRINQGYLPCFQHYSSGTFLPPHSRSRPEPMNHLPCTAKQQSSI